jgi:hypothetical protein
VNVNLSEWAHRWVREGVWEVGATSTWAGQVLDANRREQLRVVWVPTGWLAAWLLLGLVVLAGAG